MCGIFGFLNKKELPLKNKEATKLLKYSESRGKDSSGILTHSSNGQITIERANFSISELYKSLKYQKVNMMLGHTRLATNGNFDNQPVYKHDITVFHNGIIVNVNDIWSKLKTKPTLEIDTEIIAELAHLSLIKGESYDLMVKNILSECIGTISCCIYLSKQKKLILFSNNGSLFLGEKNKTLFFGSENHFLSKIGCSNIKQVFEPLEIDCLSALEDFIINDHKVNKLNLLSSFNIIDKESCLLKYTRHDLKRCTKCVLPETMPFIKFDDSGVCNYCNNYIPKNKPKPKSILHNILNESYKNDTKCIIPLSGGRDSFFCLDIAVNELGLKPVTYTYDWGMVTDLARRNISRICAELKLENIIFSADIRKKRSNIRKNLIAWLKKPHLGMISLLTAGDKHFFKYIEDVKNNTNIKLNIWGINPLETTHFKSGFLGIKPNFMEQEVYSTGIPNQINYQRLRFNQMLLNPNYFNSSIFDTLSGEYYRTFKKKKDYFHIFDYWKWEEKEVENILDKYSFEYSPDTTCSWRIGDGTAGFYNYIYYYLAGFTEHDTFRSNQIREGDLNREDALKLIEEENRPRYESIKWYLNILNLNFSDVIQIINKTSKIYD